MVIRYALVGVKNMMLLLDQSVRKGGLGFSDYAFWSRLTNQWKPFSQTSIYVLLESLIKTPLNRVQSCEQDASCELPLRYCNLKLCLQTSFW